MIGARRADKVAVSGRDFDQRMNDQTVAQTPGRREIVESLDREFARLHAKSCAVIEKTSVEILYALPAQADLAALRSNVNFTSSVGESLLRCASVIEQTFGGITSNLWDDPFEWTLPEYLSTPHKINEHLAEVEATRHQAFNSFADDDCLRRRVAVPSGETRLLVDLLLDTLIRAAAYQAQALLVLNTLSDLSPSGLSSSAKVSNVS